MEQPLTYHQLLVQEGFFNREEYDENAKDILVEQNEYEENIEPEDKHPDEIEDQEEFKKFGGSRQIVEVPKHIPAFEDKTKLSVRHEKDVTTRVISIDSRFRDDIADPATNFTFKLLTPVRNVISLRLSSFEIPNTWYNFSEAFDNLSIFVKVYKAPNNYIERTVTIGAGNYDAIPNPNGVDTTISVVLENALNDAFLSENVNFNVSIDGITSRVTISNFLLGNTTTSYLFDMYFDRGTFGNRIADFGLGYNLGYRNKIYTGKNTYTAEAIVDVIGANYLLVSFHPDWKVVTHNHPDKTQFAPFAKVIVNAPKNGIVYDNGSNTITKEYWLQQPTDISVFNVQIVDAYESTIDLVGANVSFSLELKEVLNSSLYEHMRAI